MTDGYLHTDHWVDAVASLEAAQEFSSRITLDNRNWKWLLIALHSAVQGFMVLALEQGNAIRVMRDDIADKWLQAYKSDTPSPQDKMDFFFNLYEKVKSDQVCYYFGSKKFVPGPTHDYNVKKLNEIRNHFIHFFQTTWSIELAGLPRICVDCLDVAYFLGWESGTIIWHDGELSRRGRNAAAFLRTALRAIEAAYRE
jgi:hypothetical protein